MSRITASDRLQRLLALIPWVAANDGPTVHEVCERFDLKERELLADIGLVSMVGVPPYTPDELSVVVRGVPGAEAYDWEIGRAGSGLRSKK